MSDVTHTTMYNIAEQLWHMDSANLYTGSDSQYYWDRMSEAARAPWYQRAVQIIDTAEPVWRKRVEDNYYEYLVIPATLPEARWTHLGATHVPLETRQEAEKSVAWARDEVGLETIIVRRRRGGEWERTDA